MVIFLKIYVFFLPKQKITQKSKRSKIKRESFEVKKKIAPKQITHWNNTAQSSPISADTADDATDFFLPPPPP